MGIKILILVLTVIFRAPQKDVFRGVCSGPRVLISQYFSEATSVKLVHVFNNNFYLRAFSVSWKLESGWSSPSESMHFCVVFYDLKGELFW
jgi:hypothetical protein